MIKNAKQKRRLGLLAAGVLAWSVAADRHGSGAAGAAAHTGPGIGGAGTAAASPGVMAACGVQRGAHPAGVRAGSGMQHPAGGSSLALDSGGTAACAGDAAGKSHTGGQFYHFSACMGQRPELVGADQLFDGAAGAVWCGAHRDRQRGWAAGRDGAGVPSVLVAEDAGHLAASGAARFPAGVQRGAGHLLEGAGVAAEIIGLRTAAWGMPCTGPRSPWLLGRCLPGRRSSCC